MRSDSYKTVKTTGRRYKGNPIVLWPIAGWDSGLNNDPVLGNVCDQYLYPSIVTDTSYIFWDGPSDMGYVWKGFFGGLRNLSPEGRIDPNTGHSPAEIYRIDIFNRGYSTKSQAQLAVQFKIRGVAYTLTPMYRLGNGVNSWFTNTLFGNWSFEDFNKPLESADFTNGPYLAFDLGGQSANKDAYLYNTQIHLYRK